MSNNFPSPSGSIHCSSLWTPSRRRFLQFSGAALTGAALSNCRRTRSESSTLDTGAGSRDVKPTSGPLQIYTWSDYSNPDIYQRFTQQTGIEVVADTYDSNETMLAKMQVQGGNDYSILYPSDYMVKQLVDLQLLLPLDHSRLKGLDQLRSPWQDPTYDPNNTHSIPLCWGTTGLIYDTKILNPGPDSWNYLWDNQDNLTGKITLLDDVRETLGATLKSLGYSYNSTDPQAIEAAFQKLKTLKPAVASFISFGWEDQLIGGDFTLCMTYSITGNALPLEYPNLAYVLPQEGTSLWTDTLVIPKSAPNIEAAYAWLNFILDPENAAFMAETLTFATPNQAAFDLLPAELKDNINLYPTAEMLTHCEGITPVGETATLYDQYWTQLLSV